MYIESEKILHSSDLNSNIDKLYLNSLILINYRNFSKLELKIDSDTILITGNNGVGKTNILESISMLLPGKGFRGANYIEIARNYNNQISPWCIEASIDSIIGKVSLITKLENDKKTILINQHKSNNNDLSLINSIVWLIPQMNMLFIGPREDRRKFLDRQVYNFDPTHASRINEYEHLIKERMKILQTNPNDHAWLNIVENKIAELATSIAFSRVETIEYLQKNIDDIFYNFNRVKLSLDNIIEKQILEGKNAIFIEDYIRENFARNRKIDLDSGRTHFGVHKTDLNVWHLGKAQAAKVCSTGEQKIILLSIIIAEVFAKIRWKKIAPILLLDEVLVHFDKKIIMKILELIKSFKCQTWITATNDELFKTLKMQQIHLN